MDPHTLLYRTPTPEAYPSAQLRSAQSIVSWNALCNLPSLPCPQGFQAANSTQSWDSQNGPRPELDLAATPQPLSPLFSSFLESLPGPPPIPEDSQPSASDQAKSQASALSMLSHHLSYDRAVKTTRDLRLQIKTALLFKIPYVEIRSILNVIDHQISIARNIQLIPQKARHIVKLYIPEKQALKDFLYSSPSHRHILFREIYRFVPQIYGAKEEAIRTAYKDIGYGRHKSVKKGFSDNLAVMKQRVNFARDSLTWRKARIQRICFIDEIWAIGGAHTDSWVTVLDNGSKKYLPAYIKHKYSKLLAWLFHGSIVDGHKGPCCFWEKEWETVNAEKYILIAQLCPSSG